MRRKAKKRRPGKRFFWKSNWSFELFFSSNKPRKLFHHNLTKNIIAFVISDKLFVRGFYNSLGNSSLYLPKIVPLDLVLQTIFFQENETPLLFGIRLIPANGVLLRQQKWTSRWTLTLMGNLGSLILHWWKKLTHKIRSVLEAWSSLPSVEPCSRFRLRWASECGGVPRFWHGVILLLLFSLRALSLWRRANVRNFSFVI